MKTMKRCKFCDHLCRTDKGERVCSKYLVHLDDDDITECNGFDMDISASPIAAWILTLVVMFMIIALT